MKARHLPAAAAIVAAAAGGCSLAPHYERPSTQPPPATYKEAGDWKVSSPSDTSARGRWWTTFGDSDLDALEAEVTHANQTLKSALASLEQARAQTRITRSEWFPTLTAQASATRGELSAYAPGYTPGKTRTGNSFVLSGDLSYEIDVFGRVRNTVANARANEQATSGDVAALDLSVHAELATDYFMLRGLDIEQRFLDQTVADYARALQLTQNLFKGGAAAIADVQQAQAQLELARTQAEDTRLHRAQTEHAIDTGLPSQLLERRPDVAAANANIGVARAAYFPVFDLMAQAGLQSTTAANWLTAPAQFWSIGPQALLTIFDGGLHRAQSAAAHAVYDEQVANYRNTVLIAYQDVEDNLAALRQLHRESISQAAAVTATQGAADQANLRYKGGIVTYLEVVATQNAALSARLTAVDIDIRRATATVQLVKALGGDWNAPPQ